MIEYDGTCYCGSQLQKNGPTIQGEIEKALKKLTGVRKRVSMASRTDAGVHARGQVASFVTDAPLPLRAYVEGMNSYLPRDIAVREAFRADDALDVRRSAVSREYRYAILNCPTRSPMREVFACRVGGHLDIGAMQAACRALIGRHDFASFIGAATGKSTVRNVIEAKIEQNDDMIVFDMAANSFLPHQVRNTVGALLKVGQGRMTVEEFGRILEARTPGLAGPTAPAGGLCLIRVNYQNPFEGEAR
jgi:tRNA pseudouridine38-40 synthase